MYAEIFFLYPTEHHVSGSYLFLLMIEPYFQFKVAQMSIDSYIKEKNCCIWYQLIEIFWKQQKNI